MALEICKELECDIVLILESEYFHTIKANKLVTENIYRKDKDYIR